MLRALADALVFDLLRASSVDLPVDTALLVEVVAWHRSLLLLLGLMVFEALQLFLSVGLQFLKILLALLLGGTILGLSQKVDGDVVEVVHDFVELGKHYKLQVLKIEAHEVFQLLLCLGSRASNCITHLRLEDVSEEHLQHLVKVHHFDD